MLSFPQHGNVFLCPPPPIFFRTHISNMHVYSNSKENCKEQEGGKKGWHGVWWVESCQCELTFLCRDSESSVSARDSGVNVSEHLNVKSRLVLHSCCFGIWIRALRAKVLLSFCGKKNNNKLIIHLFIIYSWSVLWPVRIQKSKRCGATEWN